MWLPVKAMTAGVSSTVHPPNPAELAAAPEGAGPCPAICPWGGHSGSRRCWEGPGHAGWAAPLGPGCLRALSRRWVLLSPGSRQDPPGHQPSTEQQGFVAENSLLGTYLWCVI